jgi:outer membrane biosynthesis protein TonB
MAHEEAEADEDVRVLDIDDEALGRTATDAAAPAASTDPRSPDEIRGIVRAHLSAFAHCYDQLLATAPTAEGRVLLRMTIAADGLVGDVTIAQSTIPSMPPEMATCMQDAARTLHFGAHHEATVVNYPFQFSTSGAPAEAPPPSTAAAPPPSTTAEAPPPSTAATPPPSTTTGRARGHH